MLQRGTTRGIRRLIIDVFASIAKRFFIYLYHSIFCLHSDSPSSKDTQIRRSCNRSNQDELYSVSFYRALYLLNRRTVLAQLDFPDLLIRSIRDIFLAHGSIIDELGFPVLDSLLLPDFVEEV